jgi:hypothetical protein
MVTVDFVTLFGAACAAAVIVTTPFDGGVMGAV